MVQAAIVLVLSFAAMFLFEIQNWYYVGLMFAACYAVTANTFAMRPYLTGKITMAGANVAHIGFGILLIGVLVSSANKRVISINQSGMQLNPEFDAQANMEHVFLEKNISSKRLSSSSLIPSGKIIPTSNIDPSKACFDFSLKRTP